MHAAIAMRFMCDLNPNRLNRLADSLMQTVTLKALPNQNKTGKQTLSKQKTKKCATIKINNNKLA